MYNPRALLIDVGMLHVHVLTLPTNVYCTCMAIRLMINAIYIVSILHDNLPLLYINIRMFHVNILKLYFGTHLQECQNLCCLLMYVNCMLSYLVFIMLTPSSGVNILFFDSQLTLINQCCSFIDVADSKYIDDTNKIFSRITGAI